MVVRKSKERDEFLLSSYFFFDQCDAFFEGECYASENFESQLDTT
jgi:hypothetical protein